LQPGTALHKAARGAKSDFVALARGHTAIVNYLIGMGAELDVQDSKVVWLCLTNACVSYSL
jgi:hypothetical protein